jgi:hypothetical protein
MDPDTLLRRQIDLLTRQKELPPDLSRSLFQLSRQQKDDDRIQYLQGQHELSRNWRRKKGTITEFCKGIALMIKNDDIPGVIEFDCIIDQIGKMIIRLSPPHLIKISFEFHRDDFVEDIELAFNESYFYTPDDYLQAPEIYKKQIQWRKPEAIASLLIYIMKQYGIFFSDYMTFEPAIEFPAIIQYYRAHKREFNEADTLYISLRSHPIIKAIETMKGISWA